MLGIGRGDQDGVMAVRVEAKHDLAGRGFFDSQPLRSDRHAAIGADLERRAHAPDVIPNPGAFGKTG